MRPLRKTSIVKVSKARFGKKGEVIVRDQSRSLVERQIVDHLVMQSMGRRTSAFFEARRVSVGHEDTWRLGMPVSDQGW